MKNPSEWDESDIQAMIDAGVKESIELDYKASAELSRQDWALKELSKDVSAFANSAGGDIVYGVKEYRDKEREHLPEKIDEGFDPSVIGREWLEQQVHARIHPRIEGLRINQIGLSGGNSGRVIYAVHVPKSFRTPHQADDKKFYKRYNFMSVPMEEYEIRDLFGRQEVPDLSLTLELQSEPLFLRYPKPGDYSAPFPLFVSISNSTTAVSEYRVINLLIDSQIRVRPVTALEAHTTPDVPLERNGRLYSVTKIQVNHFPTTNMPVWKGIEFSIFTQPLTLSLPPMPGDFLIGWTIDAPRMGHKEEFGKLHSTAKHARLEPNDGGPG